MLANFEVARRAAGSAAFACAVLAGCSRELPAERAAIASREPQAALGAPSASSTSESPQPSLAGSGAARGRGVAVVELFTSEGCSSCPPADRVLAALTARAKAEALPVYTLSFHVDYWNYLGWRDRFSSSSYSERQHNYSAISENGGTYTPQVVVNGDDECVGSNASRIDSLIDAALKRQPRTQIELEARRIDHGIDVSYRVSGDTQARVLNLALVEPRAESQVQSGENAGERLAHVNVVRVFTTLPLSAGAVGHWSPPPNLDLDARRVGVVAFAEGVSQRDISGATALELP